MRAAAFQVTSVITTTGFFTVDYDQWPVVALMTLGLLFFVGGCAGSTAGSIKIARHLLVARLLGREVARTVHPELLRPVRFNGAVVDQQALLAVISFILIYVAVFVLGTAVLAVEASVHGPDVDALDLVFASAATLGNAGFGLGVAGRHGLLRRLRRCLDGRDDSADVARPAGDRPHRRAPAPQLLARLTGLVMPRSCAA